MYITGVIIDLILKKNTFGIYKLPACADALFAVESADLAKKITIHCVVFIKKNCVSLIRLCSKCKAGSVKRSSREYFPFSFFYDVECVTVTI